MVKLRFKRFGRTHHPVYRLNAIDQRSPRDGRPIEQLGTYDPANKDESVPCGGNGERGKYWLIVGAQPSETVAALLKKAGVMEATKKA